MELASLARCYDQPLYNGTSVRDHQGAFESFAAIVVSCQSQSLGNKQSFEDVPITADGVETVSFLDAAEGLVSLFGMWIDHLFR